MQGFRPAFAACPEDSRRLLDLTERFKVAVTISDIDQEDCPVLHANGAFARLTGHALEDVRGRSILNLHHGSQQRQLADRRAIALSDSALEQTVLLSRRADGTAFEELVFLQLLGVPGYTGWLISCHFDLDRQICQNRPAFAWHNFELRARNAIRVFETEAALTHMLTTFAQMGEDSTDRSAKAVSQNCAA